MFQKTLFSCVYKKNKHFFIELFLREVLVQRYIVINFSLWKKCFGIQKKKRSLKAVFFYSNHNTAYTVLKYYFLFEITKDCRWWLKCAFCIKHLVFSNVRLTFRTFKFSMMSVLDPQVWSLALLERAKRGYSNLRIRSL